MTLEHIHPDNDRSSPYYVLTVDRTEYHVIGPDREVVRTFPVFTPMGRAERRWASTLAQQLTAAWRAGYEAAVE